MKAILCTGYGENATLGFAWAQRFPRQSAAADEALLRMVAGGELPWDDYAAAMAAISARQAKGRLVLAVRGRAPSIPANLPNVANART